MERPFERTSQKFSELSFWLAYKTYMLADWDMIFLLIGTEWHYWYQWPRKSLQCNAHCDDGGRPSWTTRSLPPMHAYIIAHGLQVFQNEVRQLQIMHWLQREDNLKEHTASCNGFSFKPSSRLSSVQFVMPVGYHIIIVISEPIVWFSKRLELFPGEWTKNDTEWKVMNLNYLTSGAIWDKYSYR